MSRPCSRRTRARCRPRGGSSARAVQPGQRAAGGAGWGTRRLVAAAPVVTARGPHGGPVGRPVAGPHRAFRPVVGADQGRRARTWHGVVLEEEYRQRRSLPRRLRPPAPTEPPSRSIRTDRGADLPYIREIYNHYVANSTVTFDEDVMTFAEWKKSLAVTKPACRFSWRSTRRAGARLRLVDPWNGRRPLAPRRRELDLPGAGRRQGARAGVDGRVDRRWRDHGIREMIAVIADRSADASIRLHEAFGFVEIGRMGRSATSSAGGSARC